MNCILFYILKGSDLSPDILKYISPKLKTDFLRGLYGLMDLPQRTTSMGVNVCLQASVITVSTLIGYHIPTINKFYR